MHLRRTLESIKRRRISTHQWNGQESIRVTHWLELRNFKSVRNFQKRIKMMKKTKNMFLGITYIEVVSLRLNVIQMTWNWIARLTFMWKSKKKKHRNQILFLISFQVMRMSPGKLLLLLRLSVTRPELAPKTILKQEIALWNSRVRLPETVPKTSSG